MDTQPARCQRILAGHTSSSYIRESVNTAYPRRPKTMT